MENICKLKIGYFILAALRLLFTVLPQPGYLHPDEFFQSTEVVVGDVFDVFNTKTWEFNRESPIRCIGIMYIVYSLPYFAMQYLMTSGVMNMPSTYLLVVAPRLICCFLSYIVDFSLYKICSFCKMDPNGPMLALTSSYVMFTYATRTFSNTIELVLFSLLLYFISECIYCSSAEINGQDKDLGIKLVIKHSKDAKIERSYTQSSEHIFRYSSLISLLLITGIFNRPTFMLFAFVPVFFWLRTEVSGTQNNFFYFHLKFITLIIHSAMFAGFYILIDSAYYKQTTLAELLSFNLTAYENYVLTPYNFVLYNMNSTNLATHGIHPRYTHMLLNIPLMFSVLGIGQLCWISYHLYRFCILRWNELPKLHSIRSLLICSFVVPLLALSVFSHQEARFIIPLIIPIVFCQSDLLYPKGNSIRWKKVFRVIWFVGNLISFIFYGFMHQAGLLPIISHLSEEYHANPDTRMYVINTYTYSIPMSLLAAPIPTHNSEHPLNQKYEDNSNPIVVYNVGSLRNLNAILGMVKAVHSVDKRRQKRSSTNSYQTYVIIPTIFEKLLYELLSKDNISLDSSLSFYPHFSTESFLYVYENNLYSRSGSTTSTLTDMFGLSLIRCSDSN